MILPKFVETITSDRELANLVIVYGVVLTFWTASVLYRELYDEEWDFLAKDVVGGCNGWCVGHFLHYTAMAYLSPTWWPLLVITGILFEFMELALSKVSKYVEANPLADPITNTLGVFTGLLLFQLRPHEISLLGLGKWVSYFDR